jgi:hypothetical protein
VPSDAFFLWPSVLAFSRHIQTAIFAQILFACLSLSLCLPTQTYPMAFYMLVSKLSTPCYRTWKLTYLSSCPLLCFSNEQNQQHEEKEEEQQRKQQQWLQDHLAVAVEDADIEAAADRAAEELKRAQWSGEHHKQYTYRLCTFCSSALDLKRPCS